MKAAFAMPTGSSHDIATAPWFAPVLVFFSSVLTGGLLWLGQRLVGKAAWQAAMTAANQSLINEIQEERRILAADFATYKIEATAERTRLQGEIANLTQSLDSLKTWMRKKGIQVPLARIRPTSGLITIPPSEKSK